MLEEDPGAIDGISYAGCGESLSQQQFLNLEGLPSIFRWVTVRFLFEDGTEETRRIQQGKELAAEKIPELPEKPGYTAEWEGLETLAPVFDTVVRAVYTPYRTVIASTNQRTDGRPVLLAEGSFPPDAEVTVEASELLPEQSRNLVWKAGSITVTASEAVSKATVLEALRFTVPEDCGQVVYRYLPPEGTGENPVLLVRQEDGSWAQAQTTRSGSYLVFDAVGTETVIVLTQEQTGAPWWAFAVGGAVLILAALAICLVIRKKKRSC